MKKVKLGNSDMEITRIGLGAWAIGGEWTWGWGKQDDGESVKTIHKALDAGINWIDTAPVYGLGRSETVVGKAVKGMSEKPLIFTKNSFRWNGKGVVRSTLKAESVRQEVDESLQRLGTDVIDLLQIHWPNPEGEIEEAWEMMASLQKAGKVRWIGVSNHSVEQMKRLQAIAPITSLQPPYNMLRREVEAEILPYCRDSGIGTIVYSPMASGLLTGKMTRERIENLDPTDWRKKSDAFNEPRLSRNLEIVEALKEIGAKHGAGPGQIAIAWTLKNEAVTAAIVGMRRPDQVDGIIGAENIDLDNEDMLKIAALL